MRPKGIQAKHLPDAELFQAIRYAQVRRGEGNPDSWTGGPDTWVSVWEVQERLQDYPPKVVGAKLASAERRGLVHACLCGCRGDIFFTEAGRVRLWDMEIT